MPDVIFTIHNGTEILHVDLVKSTLGDQDALLTKCARIMRLYRKDTPLRMMYDLRGVVPTRDLISYFSSRLMPFSKKVYRRAFIVNTAEVYYMLRTVIDSRKMNDNTIICEGTVEAQEFLVSGKRTTKLSLENLPTG